MGGMFAKKSPGSKPSDLPQLSKKVQKTDDPVLNQLRRYLMEKPEEFVLNNILLSMQFYENFERERLEFQRHQTSEREIQLNRALADCRKHCLLPDTMMAAVNERVRFQWTHGPRKKEKSEPLLPERMFIVHDNIEVLVEGETNDYSTVDGPVHRAVLEFGDKSGYIQLRQIELLNVNGPNGDVDADESTDDAHTVPESPSPRPDESLASPVEQQVYAQLPQLPSPRAFEQQDSAQSTPTTKEKHFFSELGTGDLGRRYSDSRQSSLKSKILRSRSMSMKLSENTPLQRAKSVEHVDKAGKQPQQQQKQKKQPQQKKQQEAKKKEDTEYDYTTFRRLTGPKPLDEIRAHKNPSNVRSIPARCITKVSMKKLYPDVDEEASDEESEFLPTGRRRPPTKKQPPVLYETKWYFNSEQFFRHFGDVFRCIDTALGFSDEESRRASTQYGAIHCSATDKHGNLVRYEVLPTIATTWPSQAYEWHRRLRPTIVDPTTQVRYMWPTPHMADRIVKLQAQIFPFGFPPKRGVNTKRELEWSLSFPAAERYLGTCMSHTQVRCFFFILALHHTFLRPPTNPELGLSPHHIRTLMLWECEKNYIDWPETFEGSKLLHVLKSLYERLSKSHLPDYFVRWRNTLETCLSKDLRYSQERLRRIMERPVLYMVAALRNLRYTNDQFFPRLDFHRLYRLLTVDELLPLENPKLASLIVPDYGLEVDEDDRDEPSANGMNLWDRERKRHDEGREWKRQKKRQLEQEERAKNTKGKRRESVDSIDMQVPRPRMDTNRRRMLLEYFIAHLMAVAKQCMVYKSYDDALVILNHCEMLRILLSEEQYGGLQSQPLQKNIAEQISTCRLQQAKRAAHESRQFTHNVVGTRNLNMSKLQYAFQSGAETVAPAPAYLKFDNADALTGSTDL